VGAARHRAPRRRRARPLGGGEHALAARRRVQGRPLTLSRRPRRQEHGRRPPLRPQSPARPQIQGKRQNPKESRFLGSRLSLADPANEMTVNLDSEPWASPTGRVEDKRENRSRNGFTAPAAQEWQGARESARTNSA